MYIDEKSDNHFVAKKMRNKIALWAENVFQPICAVRIQMRPQSECNALISSRGSIKYAENRVAAITFFIYLYFFRFSAKTQRKRRKNGRRRNDRENEKRRTIEYKRKKNWWRIIAAHHHKYHAGCKRYSFFRSSAPTYARRSYEFHPKTASNFFSFVGLWSDDESAAKWALCGEYMFIDNKWKLKLMWLNFKMIQKWTAGMHFMPKMN